MPYLKEIRFNWAAVPDKKEYPFNIPAFSGVKSISFHRKVTFFVGENGSGKS
ncbi:MAG: AAA family ATPase, partial [Desulfitobacteriaceae bacterium]|nr:AAA family ATPase [Desulfitobacteriaceae bacterium]